VWTGAGTDSNWSDGLNWQSGSAPQAGDVLVFGPGATQSTTTNDLVGYTFNSVRFTGACYTVSGHAVTLTGSLDATSSTGANTFGLNVTLASNAEFNAGGSGASLTVNGSVSDAGSTVEVGGGKGTLTFAGVVSGGGGVNDYGPGTLVLSGANTYLGGTTLSDF